MLRTCSFVIVAFLFACAGPGGDDDTQEPATDGTDGDDGVVEPPDPLESCLSIAMQCKSAQQACVPATEDKDAHCQLCPIGEAPDGEYSQCAPIYGTAMEYNFGELSLQPGEEHSGWCQSWVLNNETELWVNAVEFVTDGLYHHSNWFFVPEGKHDYPVKNLWKNCYNKGFSEIGAALSGGVLFAQSTQVDRELQKFPAGVAVRIPPWSRIIGATHMLNYFPEEKTTALMMRLHTLKPDEVVTKLVPFRLSYTDLLIPAGQTVEHGSSCDIRSIYFNNDTWVKNWDWNFKLYYALPHYHSWGNNFRLSINGGPRDGELLFDLGEFATDPFGHAFDPPVDLTDADGLSFACGWRNTENHDLKWGLGEGEMCVMLGFAEIPIGFDATVQTTSSLDESGELPFSTGTCAVVAFPWNHTKEGGLPPEDR